MNSFEFLLKWYEFSLAKKACSFAANPGHDPHPGIFKGIFNIAVFGQCWIAPNVSFAALVNVCCLQVLIVHPAFSCILHSPSLLSAYYILFVYIYICDFRCMNRSRNTMMGWVDWPRNWTSAGWRPRSTRQFWTHWGWQVTRRSLDCRKTKHCCRFLSLCGLSLFYSLAEECIWSFQFFSCPSVLWHCWLGDRKGIRPVKKLGVGLLMVMIWLEICTSYSSSCHHHLHHP